MLQVNWEDLKVGGDLITGGRNNFETSLFTWLVVDAGYQLGPHL